MQKSCGKFAGCFAQIERVNKSGSTFEDHVRDALKLYKQGKASVSDIQRVILVRTFSSMVHGPSSARSIIQREFGAIKRGGVL